MRTFGRSLLVRPFVFGSSSSPLAPDCNPRSERGWLRVWAGRAHSNGDSSIGTRRRPTLLALALAAAFGIDSRSAKAVSDRLLITDTPSGTVLFDATLSEGPDGTEGYLQFLDRAHCPTSACSSDPDLSFAVILTEPAGEPPDENAVLIPGTQTVVSDVVIYEGTHDPVDHPLIVQLFSDGSVNSEGVPLLPGALNYALIRPNGGVVAVLVPETGELQDLTQAFGFPGNPWTVQVQSDVQVIPEPCTGLLVMAGLFGLAYRQRRHGRAA